LKCGNSLTLETGNEYFNGLFLDGPKPNIRELFNWQTSQAKQKYFQ
jgi:hypothetical protein